MNIIRDDEQGLVLEEKPLKAYVTSGILVAFVAALAGALYWYEQPYWLAIGAAVMFTPFWYTLLAQGPHLQVSFHHKKRRVTFMRRWPWAKKEESYAFKNISAVSAASCFTKNGECFRPILRHKNGVELPLANLWSHDRQAVTQVVERVGAVMIEATAQEAKAGRSATTAKLVVTPPTPTSSRATLLFGLAALVIIMGYNAWNRHQREVAREEFAEQAAQRKVEKAQRAADREARREARAETLNRNLEAAKGGDQEAMLRAVRVYADGKGTPEEIEKAVQMTQQAIARDIPVAYAIMGHFHAKGAGSVRQDAKAAEGWYMMAAERGSGEGFYGLSTLYYFGNQRPKDLAKAHAYMVLCARGGFGNSASAVNIIGNKLSPAEREQSDALVKQWDASYPGLKITL